MRMTREVEVASLTRRGYHYPYHCELCGKRMYHCQLYTSPVDKALVIKGRYCHENASADIFFMTCVGECRDRLLRLLTTYQNPALVYRHLAHVHHHTRPPLPPPMEWMHGFYNSIFFASRFNLQYIYK